MKYMGSKRRHLENSLGDQLRRVARDSDLFVDLFAGSGVVSWFAAEELGLTVTACDLQQYAVALSGSVIERDRPVGVRSLVRKWLEPVRAKLEPADDVVFSRRLLEAPLSAAAVERMRRHAAASPEVFCRSYGGHYFSIEQALAIDWLRATLPVRRPGRTVCLASLIMAASRCSASPGHTAQPFQPTRGALPHIDAIWRRSLLDEVEASLRWLGPRFASKRGRAVLGDASDIASSLSGGELVFVDPPYSAAQYSRFYHVLESIAVGGYDAVDGAGRAPAVHLRPNSSFSRVASAPESFRALLETLGTRRCRVVATFPQYEASNGLSGEEIGDMAREWFQVDIAASSNRFSTLGGNGDHRSARRQSQELVITMFPR